MIAIIAALLRLPVNRIARRLILGVSWAGAAFVTAGVIGFAGRATGLIVEPGKPPQSWAAWVSLAVGAIWVVAWVSATIGAIRNRPSAVAASRPDQLSAR
ncbi:hypothetical protein [Nonomuraea longicatena]|uniref:Integral membrane protein n=1 Tax=Nonomuraea longicatena TaxID=83682 RepID=A0ABN1QB02_9ACTN